MGFRVCSRLDNCLLSPAHQALDGAFNEENRERCRAATAPLIEAVDNLTAFASNPEFATVPAQISPEVGCYWGWEGWPGYGGSCCPHVPVHLFHQTAVSPHRDAEPWSPLSHLPRRCWRALLASFRLPAPWPSTPRTRRSGRCWLATLALSQTPSRN